MSLALLAMIGLPLVLALLLAVPRLRPLVVAGLGLAPLPGLFLLPNAWGGAQSVALPGGWRLVIDQPGALMLLASVLLWMIAGAAASRWLASRPDAGCFALWWLLTLSGSLGVFVAGDLVSFYALYALASLPAYGLITFGGGDAEQRAGRLTLAAALTGEGLVLTAFVLMAVGASGRGLEIPTVMAALPSSPFGDAVILLVVLGFGLKIGLVPLHGWMPVSYAAGPLVATAVLSGATSKAGIIGLIRFLPMEHAMPVAGGLVVAAGLFSALYGAVLGLTQSDARSVLAYSSISQFGQMVAVLGVGLAAGMPGAAVAVAYYAVYHVLTKGGMFLWLGAQRHAHPPPRWQSVLAGAAALGFAGLPLTGGDLGKLAFKDVAGGGVTGTLLSVAAIGSTALMLHFLRLVRSRGQVPAGHGLGSRSWIAAVCLAMLFAWVLFAAATGKSPAAALAPSALAGLLWPVAAGALLFAALGGAGTLLPRLPPGDLGAGMMAGLAQTGARLQDLARRSETGARQWPMSALSLAAMIVIFVVLQVAWPSR